MLSKSKHLGQFHERWSASAFERVKPAPVSAVRGALSF
jgi:hypothetical protein